ncbi:MAG: transposase [Flavobacteriaceae bacterium]|nr:MAG: transposase [Flavobacteriaceae bacterium]QMU63297.1 MAG: transposase [Flavobacteriaceae bacterium]QMU63765.1 MAG: transposase [Flavobacteriaceae bacterium]QMU64601.1 MAG: transposase [Flavobacteriaceae bacterium]QMU64761.1 MAG: transposase [Flavobacteriaceae bacterium]
MDTYIDLLKLILPELLVEHFDLSKHSVENEVMHLYFEERNIVPKEESERILIAHGFHKELTIQDFPLRGNTVYLHIKRRRWLDRKTKQIVQRDWNLVAQGTRMTEQFAAFLKEISR